MENASKALIMAMGILVALMTISIAVYVFNVFANYSRENNQVIENAQLAKFNNQFTKFYGVTYGKKSNGTMGSMRIKCTIHDIVNLANLAQENNLKYNFLVPTITSGKLTGYTVDTSVVTTLPTFMSGRINTNYIRIELRETPGGEPTQLELKTTQDLIKLLKKYDLEDDTTNPLNAKKTKYYVCNTCFISDITHRVSYMQFSDYRE